MCDGCGKSAGSLFYSDGQWICRHCRSSPALMAPSFIGTEYLTKEVPNATTGHLKDLEDRQWNPTEKRLVYRSKEGLGKTYFFPKRG